jgi:hypothetical protein
MSYTGFRFAKQTGLICGLGVLVVVLALPTPGSANPGSISPARNRRIDGDLVDD